MKHFFPLYVNKVIHLNINGSQSWRKKGRFAIFCLTVRLSPKVSCWNLCGWLPSICAWKTLASDWFGNGRVTTVPMRHKPNLASRLLERKVFLIPKKEVHEKTASFFLEGGYLMSGYDFWNHNLAAVNGASSWGCSQHVKDSIEQHRTWLESLH